MRTIKAIISICIFFLPLILKAEYKEIPFTIDDRDRIIRTEQKIEALDAKIDTKVAAIDAKIDMKVDGLRTEMNGKFDGLRSEMTARFDQLFNFLWAIIGIFTTMMVSVFGFAFWDRRLSLSPIKRENERTLNVLREYAKHQPKLLELLKNAGLL
jgi:hypothetical protein